jgi:hypothetical protein
MGFPLRDGRGWRPDSWEEVGTLLVLGLLVSGVFAYSTSLDAQARYLLTNAPNYFSVADSSGDTVSFSEQDIDRMRWASITSVGSGAFGDERLFCGSIKSNGFVESIRLADDIRLSEYDSVSGACSSRFPSQDINFFVHSQPGSEGLSEEDRDLETMVPYTCIVYEEMAVSPVSGSVDGINCLSVVGNGDGFEPVSVYAR